MGKVKAVCISEKRGTEKKNIKTGVFVENFGIEGDAHAGDWHRQVSLLSYDKVEEFRAEGAEIEDGAFGENVLVEGIDFRNHPVGTRFRCNDVILEMTQIGKECHTHCTIHQRMGKCIMPIEGVFARVIHGGIISVGDEMEILPWDANRPFTAAVITLSDKGAAGEREDQSGPLIAKRLKEHGYVVEEQLLLPDGKEALKKELVRLADQRQIQLILTTGGTGFSQRDLTPEATLEIADRQAPGIAEAIRAYSMQITPRGMLSRGQSVLRKTSLIVNLPGSPKAVDEICDFLLEPLKHGLQIADGTASECGKNNG